MATCKQVSSSKGVYDLNCTQCKKQEQFTEAEKFCVQCEEYFCEKCLPFHENFGATKGHRLLNCKEVSTRPIVTRLTTCKLHDGKEEDMVCAEHDVVCCRVCLVTQHKLCQETDYLYRAAESFKVAGKMFDLNKDLNSKIEELQLSYKEQVIRAVQLKMRKKTTFKRLKLFQESMAELIEHIVTETAANVEKTLDPEVSTTQKSIEDTDKVLKQLTILSEDLSNENDPIAAYKKALECKHTMRHIGKKQDEHNTEMTVIDKALVKLVESVNRRLHDNSLFGIVTISDQAKSTIVANMCMLPDSSFCLANFEGNEIIHVDKSLKKVNQLTTECKVWGICPINDTEVAYTMPALKKVQFTSFKKASVCATGFSTEICCRGIAFYNEYLYVTGGGSWFEENGKIHVFDIEGRLLKRFEQDAEGKLFSMPRSVLVNSDNIYVADYQNGVICLNFQGQRKWMLKNSKIQYPWGLCFTPNGNILASGRDSNNILVISKDGDLFGELLNESDGISAPKALCIDTSNDRLLVTTSKGSVLKMLELDDLDEGGLQI